MRTTIAAALAAVALAGSAAAQEARPEDRAKAPDAQAQDEDRPVNRPSIRVLQNPYDIASFYRSGGSSPDGWAGLGSDPAYAIAGFYRSHEGGYPAPPYGWSAFWTNGYGARRPVPLRPYRRSIGENGDLFLLVPFLAPVGPLSGAFFGY
jgi:hypothetical protein